MPQIAPQLHNATLLKNAHNVDDHCACSTLSPMRPFIIPFKRSKDGYSELSKLLHRMILNNYEISKKLFKREVKKYAKDRVAKNQFLIVTGLARAGTTSLMTDLFNTQYFCSLDYANMPFLIAPNSWKKWHKPKSSKLKERSHKDGLMIGLNSVEALEEHFFKILGKMP